MFEKLIYDVYIWRGNLAYGLNDGGRISMRSINSKNFLDYFIF